MVLDFAKEEYINLPEEHRHCEKCGKVIGLENGTCKDCIKELIGDK